MPQQDAVTLLDADHNEVAGLFQQYKSAHNDNQKRVIAQQICQELDVHMQIEEEIFYPAFRAAAGDGEVVQEGKHEHDEARGLMQRIQETPADARLLLELEDAILHHVNDEREKMFPQARKNRRLDLMELGGQLQARKTELAAAQAA